jgi:hypothetical protein
MNFDGQVWSGTVLLRKTTLRERCPVKPLMALVCLLFLVALCATAPFRAAAVRTSKGFVPISSVPSVPVDTAVQRELRPSSSEARRSLIVSPGAGISARQESATSEPEAIGSCAMFAVASAALALVLFVAAAVARASPAAGHSTRATAFDTVGEAPAAPPSCCERLLGRGSGSKSKVGADGEGGVALVESSGYDSDDDAAFAAQCAAYDAQKAAAAYTSAGMMITNDSIGDEQL